MNEMHGSFMTIGRTFSLIMRMKKLEFIKDVRVYGEGGG